MIIKDKNKLKSESTPVVEHNSLRGRESKILGDEEDGKNSDFEHPVLIVRKFNNNIFLGIPLTSNEYKDGKYYHKLVSFPGSTAILSQVRLFDAKMLLRYIEKLESKELKEIKLK